MQDILMKFRMVDDQQYCRQAKTFTFRASSDQSNPAQSSGEIIEKQRWNSF